MIIEQEQLAKQQPLKGVWANLEVDHRGHITVTICGNDSDEHFIHNTRIHVPLTAQQVMDLDIAGAHFYMSTAKGLRLAYDEGLETLIHCQSCERYLALCSCGNPLGLIRTEVCPQIHHEPFIRPSWWGD